MTELMPSSTSVERTPSKRRPKNPQAVEQSTGYGVQSTSEAPKEKSFSIMEAKPKPRNILEATPNEKASASETEKTVTEIRSKLKGKETILQHPEALGDAQQALREFFDKRNPPNEDLLSDTIKAVQSVLYEYQARLEKVPTLRVSKEIKNAKSEEFLNQREQLESILSILMQTNNPAQARKDAGEAYSKYTKWRNEQQVGGLQKRLKELNDQSEALLEKEYALQAEIGHVSGKAHLGNSADEIRNNLKLSFWQRAKEYIGSMAGHTNVNDLISTLDQTQKERLQIQAQIDQTESQINPSVPISRMRDTEKFKSTITKPETFGTEEEKLAWEALKAEAITATSENVPAVEVETPKAIVKSRRAPEKSTESTNLEAKPESLSDHEKLNSILKDMAAFVMYSASKTTFDNRTFGKILAEVRRMNPQDKKTPELEDVNRLAALISAFKTAWQKRNSSPNEPERSLAQDGFIQAARDINDFARQLKQKSEEVDVDLSDLGISETEAKAQEPVMASEEASEQLTDEDIITLKTPTLSSPHIPLTMDFSDLEKPVIKKDTEYVTPERRRKQEVKKLQLQLKLLKQSRQEMQNELGEGAENRQEAKTDLRNWKGLADYEKQIKTLEASLQELTGKPARLEEPRLSNTLQETTENEIDELVTPEVEIIEEPKKVTPPPPSSVPSLRFDDALRLDDINNEAASKSGNVYALPKRRLPIKQEPRVVLSKDTEVVPDIYDEARENLKQGIARISDEDKKRIYFSVNEYFRQALERNDAYKRGDEKTGDKIQRQIEKMNIRLREVGALGHYEDPATTSTGKSGIGRMGVIGGSKFTERMNRGALTKNIPSLRRAGAEMTKVAHLETKETQGFEPMTVEWANDILGKTTDNEPIAAKEWERVTPLISEGRLRRKISTAVEKSIKQISSMSGLSKTYYATADLMSKVRSDSKFNGSPEAAMYIFLKALRPANEADNQAQAIVDKTLSTIDDMFNATAALIKPEATEKIEAEPVNEAFRREVLDLVPDGKKSPHHNHRQNYERVLDSYFEAIKEGKANLAQAMAEELDELNKEIGIENEDAIKKLMALSEESEAQETRMAG